MTHSSLLRSDETLFRDPEVFEFTFLPGHLHHRDAQVRELAFLLRPALRGGSAGSAVLRGPPGTGKTTTVRHLFTAVREETRRVVPAYVNCRHDHTPLAVYRSIFAQICSCPAPSAGRYLRRDPAGDRRPAPGTQRRTRRLPRRRKRAHPGREPTTPSSTRSSGSTRSGTSKSPGSLRSRATSP